MVYVSFLPEQLKAEKSKSKGIHDLKAFLEYAQRGREVLSRGPAESVGEHESPFEEAVALKLEARGWQLIPQVGVSKFRVDLGVVHPDRPGTFLAGIECDGATYHRSATARDRDKIREQILRNLGWEILRIWSPDWWYDPEGALEKIEQQLDELLQQSRESPEPEPELKATSSPEVNRTEPVLKQAQLNLVSEEHEYREAYLDVFEADPDLFYDSSYRKTLREMIRAILEVEAPIRDDILAQKIARVHGWARTGRIIREHVFSLLKSEVKTKESTGRFIWKEKPPAEQLPFRTSGLHGNVRPVSEIALAELIGFIDENRDLLTESDPALSIAREMGISRLTSGSRERIEEAIQVYQTRMA